MLLSCLSSDTERCVWRRNINYTNRCTYACGFCAFSKGRVAEELRGAPYLLPYAEISRRTREAWARGASETCMQGGIPPRLHRSGPALSRMPLLYCDLELGTLRAGQHPLLCANPSKTCRSAPALTSTPSLNPSLCTSRMPSLLPSPSRQQLLVRRPIMPVANRAA